MQPPTYNLYGSYPVVLQKTNHTYSVYRKKGLF